MCAILCELGIGFIRFFSEYNHTPFGRHQNSTTFTAYCRLIVQLVSFLIRTRNHPTYTLPLPAILETSVANLVDSLQYVGTIDVDTEAIQLAIHRLLFNLWTQTWDASPDNLFPDPTLRFIIHTQVKLDGSFKEPSVIKPAAYPKLPASSFVRPVAGQPLIVGLCQGTLPDSQEAQLSIGGKIVAV